MICDEENKGAREREGKRETDLVVGEREVELLHARLDGVPAGQTVTNEEKRVNETMDLAMKIEYRAYPIET